jgi:uncharacterized cupredoxin-like copper-binding protein
MRLGVAALLAAPLLGACFSGAEADEQAVVVEINHSRFDPGHLTFEEGTTVRFVIRNEDPIDHEFILGDREVQARHEVGRDSHHHGRVPGEISVPAGRTRSTSYTIEDAGTLIIGCHLPSHYRYGMRAEVVVVP